MSLAEELAKHFTTLDASQMRLANLAIDEAIERCAQEAEKAADDVIPESRWPATLAATRIRALKST